MSITVTVPVSVVIMYLRTVEANLVLLTVPVVAETERVTVALALFCFQSVY